MKLSMQIGLIVGAALGGVLVGAIQGQAAIQGLRGATLAAGGVAVVNFIEAGKSWKK